jgi:hypothetical protein
VLQAETAVESASLDSAPGRAASEGIGRLGSEIEQLVSVRERLLADTRELLKRYERQLDELELQDASEVQSAVASLLSTPSPPPAGVGALDVPPRPAFFQGLVTVTVGGVNRIQTVQVLEDSLSRVRHAQQVYIRRWQSGALWLELSVSAGVELIGELNRVLPFPFAVQSATSQEIVVSLEGER